MWVEQWLNTRKLIFSFSPRANFIFHPPARLSPGHRRWWLRSKKRERYSVENERHLCRRVSKSKIEIITSSSHSSIENRSQTDMMIWMRSFFSVNSHEVHGCRSRERFHSFDKTSSTYTKNISVRWTSTSRHCRKTTQHKTCSFHDMASDDDDVSPHTTTYYMSDMAHG